MTRLARRGIRLDENDGESVRARCVFGIDFLLCVIGQGFEAREEAGADEEVEAAGVAAADREADCGGLGVGLGGAGVWLGEDGGGRDG